MSLTRFKCLISSCKKHFINVKNRDYHMNKFHHDSYLDIVNITSENVNDDIMYSSYIENIKPVQSVLKCSICENENKKNNYMYKNVNNLHTHIKKQHPQYEIDINSLNLLKNSNNQNDDDYLESLEFLNAFNIQDSSLSSSFIDEQVINNEKIYSFKDDVTSFLKNSNNFTILLININSLNYKYSNIKFTLDEALADILIVKET
jgi:hypothetical protein